MWRMALIAVAVMGTVARAAEENVPAKDPRLSTFRTLYQGSGFVAPANKEEWQRRGGELWGEGFIFSWLLPLSPPPASWGPTHGGIPREGVTGRDGFFCNGPRRFLMGG